jgi:hypothetical protein
MDDIDVQTLENVVSVTVEETQAVISVVEDTTSINLENEVTEVLVSNEIVAVVDVDIAASSITVETSEQGPPGPSFQAEGTDVWYEPAPMFTLTSIPKNLKLFINGIKQDILSVEQNGQEVQLLPEIDVFPGDKIEFVYNYMEN